MKRLTLLLFIFSMSMPMYALGNVVTAPEKIPIAWAIAIGIISCILGFQVQIIKWENKYYHVNAEPSLMIAAIIFGLPLAIFDFIPVGGLIDGPVYIAVTSLFFGLIASLIIVKKRKNFSLFLYFIICGVASFLLCFLLAHDTPLFLSVNIGSILGILFGYAKILWQKYRKHKFQLG
jgi:hypothetical protein